MGIVVVVMMQALLLRDGSVKLTLWSSIVPGDIIYLKEGCIIDVDARIIAVCLRELHHHVRPTTTSSLMKDHAFSMLVSLLLT